MAVEASPPTGDPDRARRSERDGDGVVQCDDGRMADADLAALEHDGWVAIPGVLGPDEAVGVAARCDALLADDADRRTRDARAAGTRHAADLLLRLPEFATLFSGPAMTRAVTHLLGGAVPVCDVSFRSPQPGFGGQSLHADDVPVTRADESHTVTCIVALCDFTADNGATAVVPGSHRRPDLQRRPDRLGLAAREVPLVGRRGTAFIMSGHLLHRGTRNRSDAPRPALQAVWRIDVPAFTLREQHAHR